jgi:hypothetical protein
VTTPENPNDAAVQATVRPVLQFSLTCDGVAPGPGGKPVFVGVFNSVGKVGRLPQFFVANRWVNGIGAFRQTVRILYPDLTEFKRTEPVTFQLPTRASSHDVYSGFINTDFDRAGVYWISVDLDDETVLSYPIPVMGMQPSGAAAVT